MDRRLQEYILEPATPFIGKSLRDVTYYDTSPEELLSTNGMGIDIVAHQVSFSFDGGGSIYASWNTVKGWMQYSLSLSKNSFVLHSHSFPPSVEALQHLTGERLTKMEVYGHSELSTDEEYFHEEGNLKKKEERLYTNEPHLLLFHFGDRSVGVANFYMSENFEPTMEFGDDIWILYDPRDSERFRSLFNFDRIGTLP